MSDTTHPFQPGVEVAIVKRSDWGGTSYSCAKVAKVHKTGRFVLEGSNQQYCAQNGMWGDIGWKGHATGGSPYQHSRRVELITDKLREEVENTDRCNRYLRVVEKFDVRRKNFSKRATDAQIADLERIYAELNVEPVE